MPSQTQTIIAGSNPARVEEERLKELAKGSPNITTQIAPIVQPGVGVTRPISEIASYPGVTPLAPPPDTGTIGSFNTEPQTDFSKLITPYTSPTPYNISGLGVSGVDTSKLSPEEQSVQQQSELAQRLNLALVGEESFRKEQKTAQDISGQTARVKDLSSQLFTLKAEQAAIQAQSAGPGETAGMLGARQAEQNRQVAVKGLLVSAQLEQARGNLQASLDLIDAAVDEKYKPLKTALNILKANMELFKDSPGYKAATAKIKKQEDELKDSEEITKRIATSYLGDAEFSANAPASVKKELVDLINSKKTLTLADEAELASKYAKYKKAVSTEQKVDTLTLGERKQLYPDLPLTLVGKSEATVISELEGSQIPGWYFELLGVGPQSSPQILEQWNTYRSQVLNTMRGQVQKKSTIEDEDGA